MLPPAALKNLSATCKPLRTSFCAQVTIISLSDPADVSKLRCTIWPRLLMVVCISESELHSKLSIQWEFMMAVDCAKHLVISKFTAVLIRPQEQLHITSCDLPSQHCAVLSDFVDKHTCDTFHIILRGLFVECMVLQLLTHVTWPQLKGFTLVQSPQLGLASMGCLSDSWHSLTGIKILDSFLNASLLLKVGTGWPQLYVLVLSNNQLDCNVV